MIKLLPYTIIVFNNSWFKMKHILTSLEYKFKMCIPSLCLHNESLLYMDTSPSYHMVIGGGGNRHSHFLPSELVTKRAEWSPAVVHDQNVIYKFNSYMVEAHAKTQCTSHKNVVACDCTIGFLVPMHHSFKT